MGASTYQVISKEVDNIIFRHNRTFRHKCMCKQLILIMQRNYNIIVQIYSYLRYTDKLLDVFFLLLAVTYQRFKRNQEGKVKLQKKVQRRIILVRNIIFWLHTLLPMSYFLSLFSSTPSFSSTSILRRKKIFLLQKIVRLFHSFYGPVLGFLKDLAEKKLA